MLRSIFVLAVMTFGVGAGLFNRFAALLLYVWFALFRPQEWLWVDISAYRPSLLLGILLVVPSIVTGVLPNLSHPLSLGILAFLGTGLVAQGDAIRPDIGWEWLDYFARLALVCLLAVSLTNSRKRFFWLIAMAALSFGFHSAKAGLASILGGGLRFYAGQAGAFVDSVAYALGTAMIIPFLIATAQNVPETVPFRRWATMGLWLAVPLSALTVISTFARAGFLALAAAGLTWMLLQRRRFTLLFGLTVAGVAALPFVPIPAGYFDRVETIVTYDEVQEESALSRLHFWRVAMDMVADNPFGVGLKNFEQRYDEYDFLQGQYGTRRAAHSSHFQVLAENGLLGMVIWTSLVGYSILICWRIRRHSLTGGLAPEDARWFRTYADALLASIAAFVVGGAFISLSLNDLTWLTFAFVASLHRLFLASVAVPVVETARVRTFAPNDTLGVIVARESRGPGR